MFKSMTGFALREFEPEGFTGSVLLKSYNNRYLDISVSLPPQLIAYEPTAQQMISGRLNRGKVEVSVRLKRAAPSSALSADAAAAKTVYEALNSVAEACGMNERPSLALVASFEGVLSYEKEDIGDESRWLSLWQSVEKELALALEEFEASRVREGAAAEKNIFEELARLEKELGLVKQHAAEIETMIKTQLQNRFAEILPQGYDEQRLLQETAVQLVRLSVNEELSRLDAHISAFRSLAAQEAPSKKLDFLCQEIGREVNTIGSKNMLVQVAHAVVEMKDALENIREQLRNVE